MNCMLNVVIGYQCINILYVKCPSIVECYKCADGVDHGVFCLSTFRNSDLKFCLMLNQ